MQDDVRELRTAIRSFIIRHSAGTDLDETALLDSVEFADSISRLLSGTVRTQLFRSKAKELQSEYQFVAIGEDCFPRTFLTTWGFKPSRKHGELSMPFDLSIHPFSAVATLIEMDYQPYFNLSNISIKQNYPVIKSLGVEFNHEQGDSFLNDDFSGFMRRYTKRVFTWRNLGISEKKLVFVCHPYPGNSRIENKTVVGILPVLQRAFARPFDLVVLDTRENCQTVSFAEGDCRVASIALPFPRRDYRWHENKDRFSSEGIDFEEMLARRLYNLLSVSWR